MPELLLPRGAASGGKRRSRGAAKSMASPQAASSRAQAPPSGRSRARSIERWASPRADRRSCAQRSARACAGDVAAWIGWAPRCWDMFCACTEWRDTPVWSPSIEVCSRDVFMSLRDLICELYIMCNTICEEISRTAIISWTRSHLSGTNFADMGPKATRSRTTTRDSLHVGDAGYIAASERLAAQSWRPSGAPGWRGPVSHRPWLGGSREVGKEVSVCTHGGRVTRVSQPNSGLSLSL